MRSTSLAIGLLFASMVLGQTACVTDGSHARVAAEVAATSSVCERLYFGRLIPGGGEVNDVAWDGFVAEVIAPRLPDGFTVYRGDGHWRGDDGISVNEPTCVLEVVHRDSPTVNRALQEIADSYVRRFRQEAVMRTRTPAAVSFIRR